jgi:hypothetical protein
MPCASCGSTDHAKNSAKACPYFQPRWNNIPPPSDETLVPYYRSFKTGFRTVIKGDDEFKRSFRQTVHTNVDSLTRVAFEASRLLQAHLQRCFEHQLPLPPFLNRSWVQKCFDIFKDRNTTDNDLNTTFSLYLSHRGDVHPLPLIKEVSSQVKVYFVKDFVTNIKTHLKTQFWIVSKRSLTARFLSLGIPQFCHVG